jgi:hydrogenase-4 component B
MTGPWSWLWVAALGLPVAAAVSLWLVSIGARTAGAGTRLSKYAALALIPSVALALAGPRAGTIDAPWLLLGTHLDVDHIGRPLLLVAALLYGAALIAAWSSGTGRRAVLSTFLLLSYAGNAGVFLAADAVTFYLCFAVMSLAGYGLVIHERTEGARRAGRIYVILTMISEMAVLWALLLTVQAGGLMLADAPRAVAGSDQRNLIIGLLIVGFGVKAGTFPLHVWLPLAHPAAPPPASAVLSGTMIKAGLVGWLRFLPLGEVTLSAWGSALIAVSLVGVFLALPPGVLQKDPKVSLAYSSISQMGFLGVLVGTALADQQLAEPCILAAVVYSVHHGMAKGGLFLGITVWRTHGDGWIRWWVLAGLALLALAVAGAPFGSGAVAKYASKEAIGSSTFLWFSLAGVLPLVGTVSTILLARAGWLLINGPRDRAWGVDGAVLSWSVVIVGGTLFTWYVAGQWTPVVAVPGFDTTTLWNAAWPILLGLTLSAAAWKLSSRALLPRWLGHPDGTTLPAGDLLIPEERAASRLVRGLERGSAAVRVFEDVAARRRRALSARAPRGVWLRGERILGDWLGSAAALTLVVAAVIVILVAVVVVA